MLKMARIVAGVALLFILAGTANSVPPPPSPGMPIGRSGVTLIIKGDNGFPTLTSQRASCFRCRGGKQYSARQLVTRTDTELRHFELSVVGDKPTLPVQTKSSLHWECGAPSLMQSKA